MPRLAAMKFDTLRRSAVTAVSGGAAFPAAAADGVIRHGAAWTIAVSVQELRYRTAVPCREERRLGDLVMTPSEEGADAGVGTAATPTGSRRDEPGKVLL